MKNLTSIVAVIVVMSMASCSGIKVSHDFDKEANFALYKTYSFTQEAEQLPIDDINRSRILGAISRELEAKGFRKADNPDVLIDVKLKAEQKQSATATSSSPYGYGYGAGYRYGMGGGFSTTTINVENYVDGTLFVDMIDMSKKQLVWQGRAVKTIDPDSSPEKRETNINYAVKQIFTKYPPTPSAK
jgi:hypothetical protein